MFESFKTWMLIVLLNLASVTSSVLDAETENGSDNLPSDTQMQIWQYIRERGDVSFLSILAQDLANSMPARYRAQLQECVKMTYDSRSYAACLVPLMERRLRYMKKWQQSKSSSYNKHERYVARQQRKEAFRRQTLLEQQQHQQLQQQQEQQRQQAAKVVVLNNKWNNMTIGASIDQSTRIERPNERVPPLTDGGSRRLVESDMSKNVADFLTSSIRQLKNITGPWANIPNLDNLIAKVKNGLPLGDHRPMLDKTAAQAQQNFFDSSLSHLMASPMYMLKDSLLVSKQLKQLSGGFVVDSYGRRKRQAPPPSSSSDSLNFLSPRFLSVFEDQRSQNPSFLSPEILSFFDSPNSLASVPELLKTLPESERVPWLTFLMEITGGADYLRMIESDKFQELVNETFILWYDNQTVSSGQLFDSKYMAVGEIFQALTSLQMDDVNNKGFAFLNQEQMEKTYGKRLYDDDFMPFDVSQYYKMNGFDREGLLLDMVDAIANNYQYPTKSAQETADSQVHRRRKRQSFASPCVAAPYASGTVGVIYLGAPQILCPSIFSYVILGPLVLSPYVLSPYIFGPFILSPELLNPFILSPYLLSPNILNPLIISPPILSPTVMAPIILSPLMLNPAILSPTVFDPLILSPLLLSPSILSPTVGSPNILSPFLLNPAILSPAVLFVNVLSPGALSPSILSPSDGPNILSPCFFCKKRRRKRNLRDNQTAMEEFDFEKIQYWKFKAVNHGGFSFRKDYNF